MVVVSLGTLLGSSVRPGEACHGQHDARFLGAGPARISGSIAVFISQPAILAYADERVPAERVNSGYSALFAIGMITKI